MFDSFLIFRSNFLSRILCFPYAAITKFDLIKYSELSDPLTFNKNLPLFHLKQIVLQQVDTILVPSSPVSFNKNASNTDLLIE